MTDRKNRPLTRLAMVQTVAPGRTSAAKAVTAAAPAAMTSCCGWKRRLAVSMGDRRDRPFVASASSLGPRAWRAAEMKPAASAEATTLKPSLRAMARALGPQAANSFSPGSATSGTSLVRSDSTSSSSGKPAQGVGQAWHIKAGQDIGIICRYDLAWARVIMKPRVIVVAWQVQSALASTRAIVMLCNEPALRQSHKHPLAVSTGCIAVLG